MKIISELVEESKGKELLKKFKVEFKKLQDIEIEGKLGNIEERFEELEKEIERK